MQLNLFIPDNSIELISVQIDAFTKIWFLITKIWFLIPN